MLKVIVLVVLVCIGDVLSESCSSASDCGTTTTCANTGLVTHIECVNGHCTCAEDPIACLETVDCHVGRCVDHDGHVTSWHCVDGYCRCVRL